MPQPPSVTKNFSECHTRSHKLRLACPPLAMAVAYAGEKVVVGGRSVRADPVAALDRLARRLPNPAVHEPNSR